MPPSSVLCAPGDGGLHDDREAELLGGGDGLVGVGGEPLGHERQAVGEQELARLGRRRARRRRRRASARSTTRSAASRSMPSSAGTVPCGWRSHSARCGQRARARAPPTPGREGGDVRRLAAQRAPGCRSRSARRRAPACRLAASRGRGVDRLRDLVGGRGHGRARRGRSTASTCGSAEHERQRRRVGRGGRAAEHVDRVRDARLRRQELRASAARGLVAELAAARARQPRTRRRRGCRARRRSSAPRRGGPSARAGCESSAATSTSSSSEAGADDAGLVEERVDRRLRAGERGRVRARRPLAGRASCRSSARGSACVRATRRASRPKRRGLPNDSTYISTSVGRVVVLPPLEQVVGRDVGLVADRDERREAEPARLGRLEQREAERAALRGEADVAGRGRAGGEGRVQARPGDGDAEAVRARSAARRARARARAAAPGARRPRCRSRRSPAEMTTSARTPLRSACSAASSTARAGQRDHGEVDRVGDLLDRARSRARRRPARRRG